jgi:tetratricopeptide (TPR) repeat protein
MSDEIAEPHLQELQALFLSALEARRRSDVDRAMELLGEVLKGDPRLAEPRLELGRLHLDTERLEDAEEHTREALRVLVAGGQWIEDLPENVVLSVAHGQLGEVLRRRAESDEVLFGPPEDFKAMLAESKLHFDKAHELDPSNEHAEFYGFQLELKPSDEA